MHKEEASQLFECLGDPYRVKIVKILYHNTSFSFSELENRIGINRLELKSHLNILVERNMISFDNEAYKCNKDVVDALMSFITTRCGCCS